MLLPASCRVSAEKSAENLMGVLLFITCCFFLAAYILSLSFAILMAMCLDVIFFGLILFGTLFVSWTWMSVSFPRLGKFSAIIPSDKLSAPFSLILL